MSAPKTYLTSDLEVLTYTGGPPKHRPVVAVPLSSKWYQLWLVHPDGGVSIAPLYDAEPDLEDVGHADSYAAGSVSGDHCWNPYYVEAWAAKHGFDLCPMARDLMIARWIRYHDGSDQIRSTFVTMVWSNW